MTKTYSKIVLFLLTISLILVSPVAQLAQEQGERGARKGLDAKVQPPAKSKGLFAVRFSENLRPEEVATMVKRTGMTPRELLYEFPGGQGDVISGGYIVPEGEDIDAALLNMQEKHSAFLREALASTKEGSAAIPDSTAASNLKILRSDLRSLLDAVQKGEFTLSGLKAAGIADVSVLRSWPRVMDVSPLSTEGHEAARAETSPQPQYLPASFSHESWAPYYGTAKVTQGLSFQTFYFNQVSAFGSTSTYEHETQVYNKNFADFDNYWSSNLPSAYYDTPFADTIDNFTIGTARASSMQNYTQYYTYMALRRGSASSATVRIKGQKGYRNPSWCTSTWCIWAQATTQSMLTFTAPIYSTWSYSY